MKTTIYCGGKSPLVAVGINQCRMLEFAFKYPGWHSFSYDRPTLRAVNALERKGYLDVVRYERDGQFRLAAR